MDNHLFFEICATHKKAYHVYFKNTNVYFTLGKLHINVGNHFCSGVFICNVSHCMFWLFEINSLFFLNSPRDRCLVKNIILFAPIFAVKVSK